jgi:hypothetical protein
MGRRRHWRLFYSKGQQRPAAGIQPQAFEGPVLAAVDCLLGKPQKMTIRPPEYKPPPRRAYTDLGWIFAALTGPATLLAVWIYCAVTYGFLLGFFLGWIPALILALLVVVATIFLWPLAAVAVLYVIYRVFGVHPELLIYIAAFVGIIAIVMIWWWHVANNKS